MERGGPFARRGINTVAEWLFDAIARRNHRRWKIGTNRRLANEYYFTVFQCLEVSASLVLM